MKIDIKKPVRTVREIAGNNRLVSYGAALGAVGLVLTGRAPSLPGWWPIAAVAAGGMAAAGWYWSDRILALLPDEDGYYLVAWGDHEIHEVSPERFGDMNVDGTLNQWPETRKPVYDCRTYDPSDNRAEATWRESVSEPEIRDEPNPADAIAVVEDYRKRFEPELAEARALKRSVRSILRKLDKERAEAQAEILDETVAPAMGEGTTVSEVIRDELPDDLHPRGTDDDDISQPVSNGHGEPADSSDKSQTQTGAEMEPEQPGVSAQMQAALNGDNS